MAAVSSWFKRIRENLTDHTLESIAALEGETLLHTLQGHTGTVNYVAWSPYGGLLAVDAGNSGFKMQLWDTIRGTLHILEGNRRGIASLAWSPDDSLLTSDGNERMYSLNTRVISIRDHSFLIEEVCYADTV